MYSTLALWTLLGQIHRLTLQLSALKPGHPIELCSCKQWAVSLDMSKVKLRNERQNGSEEEPYQ